MQVPQNATAFATVPIIGESRPPVAQSVAHLVATADHFGSNPACRAKKVGREGLEPSTLRWRLVAGLPERGGQSDAPQPLDGHPRAMKNKDAEGEQRDQRLAQQP